MHAQGREWLVFEGMQTGNKFTFNILLFFWHRLTFEMEVAEYVHENGDETRERLNVKKQINYELDDNSFRYRYHYLWWI